MPDREQPVRILHLEDDPLDAEMIRHNLAADGPACDIVLVEDKGRFEAALAEGVFDIILCDYNLRSWDGLSALKVAKERQPEAPFILVSGTLGEEEAVKCLHLGAADYLLKQRLDRLGPAVRRALGEAGEHRRRRRAEEALREANELLEERVRDRTARLASSEERLRYLLSSSPAIIYSRRPGGDFAATSVSPNVTNQLGYAPDDFLGDPGFWADRIHSDDAPRVLADLPELFERDRQEDEYRFLRKDGEWRWMRDERILVRDDSGAPREIVGAWLDVTERKRAEEALAFRSELHRVAAEISTALVNVPAGGLDGAIDDALRKLGVLFRADRSYVFRFSGDLALMSNTHEWCAPGIEPQISVIQDLPAANMPYFMGWFQRGLPLHVPDVDSLWVEAAAEQGELRRQGIQSLICLPMTRRDELLGFFGFDSVTGRRIWAQDEVSFLRVVADAFAGAFLRERDEAALRGANATLEQHVAERTDELQAANQGLLGEKAFTDAMLDSLPGIFFLFDHTGRLLRWNRSLEVVSGYVGEEIADMHPHDLFGKEDGPSIEEELARVFETGAAETEATLVAKDGREIPYYVVGVRFPVDGEPCCIGTGIDITIRRELEAQLRQAQKIEAIGQLAGGIAHDFNNILSVISIFGELALRQLGPEHPVRASVGQMMKAGERAAGLTRQLLAFSRKQVVRPTVFDLNDIVAVAHGMLSRLIGEDVDLIVRPGRGLGYVKADSGQIEQVIMNLAVNSRDAMPKGGTLLIETSNVELGEAYVAAHPYTKVGHYVLLAVSDTGVGMDEKTRRRVFEPFFTTKPEGKGTGLGLAMVYGIVKQSNGYIEVQSEPDRGTTFRVYLPRADETAEAPRPAGPPTGARGGSETILLVEDNAALCEAIRESLEAGGYTVLQAAGGEEALAVAEACTRPIDLLLTDVVMPKMGGGDLAKLLSNMRPELRVLFMSGYTEGTITQHGILGEGLVLLEKPFNGDRLLCAVREALDRPLVA